MNGAVNSVARCKPHQTEASRSTRNRDGSALCPSQVGRDGPTWQPSRRTESRLTDVRIGAHKVSVDHHWETPRGRSQKERSEEGFRRVG